MTLRIEHRNSGLSQVYRKGQYNGKWDGLPRRNIFWLSLKEFGTYGMAEMKWIIKNQNTRSIVDGAYYHMFKINVFVFKMPSNLFKPLITTAC